jgi:amidase
MDLGFYEVDKDVVANTKRALEVFKSLGATVEEVDLGWGIDALHTATGHLWHLFGTYLAEHQLKKHRKLMCEYAIQLGEFGRKSKPQTFLASMEGAAKMYSTFGPMMEKYDAFICPTTALPAVKADFKLSRDKIRINGKLTKLPTDLAWVMTPAFNTLSRCPVLAVPSGHAPNGVPTGIQIVGRSYSDADVMQAGIAYETALGGWYNSAKKRPQI